MRLDLTRVTHAFSFMYAPISNGDETARVPRQLVATVNRFLIDRGIFPAAKNPRSEKH
jgi:hypothetical protein